MYLEIESADIKVLIFNIQGAATIPGERICGYQSFKI